MINTLRLVPGEGFLHERTTFVVPSLEAHPARPGEMPETIVVDLNPEAVARVRRGVERDQVPVSLWLRVAVEASRHVAAVSRVLELPRLVLDDVLARAASRTKPVPFYGRRHHQYARFLRSAAKSAAVPRRGPPSSRVEVAVPDQLLTGWLREATALRRDLSAYISRCVVESPDNSIAMEAAASEDGRSLGEWIYAEALSITER